MLDEKAVSQGYLHGDLLNAIQISIAKIGKSIDNVTIEDLSPVDEFHIGGRLATQNFLDQLNFSEQNHILDVGCGLGGAARFAANKYKNHVTGIDLTKEYIETGKAINKWLGLEDRVTLINESALSMPFQNETFDGGFMLHVGMNIEDKDKLFKEIYRVLRYEAYFGVYDIMRQKNGKLTYPVPWATESSTSKLATPDQYAKAMSDAGFKVLNVNNRRDFALEFFKNLREKIKANGGPPPIGLHILMKETTTAKLNNLIDNLKAGLVAPVEIISKKR
jgi:ubiquinone/menaquinone biosynthesis C-methylase UbiE